jgi:hypothetical protein
MLRNTAWIGAISVCAFAVGAVQMLPAIDHVGDSARSRPFDFNLVKAWSMPWAKFAELVYPNILGHISIDQVMWYWAGGVYPGMGSPFLFSIYPGLAVIALAVAGVMSRHRGWVLLLLLIFFSSLIALGGNTPLLESLHRAGIATSIRYPEKFILIALFAITIFATRALQRLFDGDDGARETAAGFALAATVVAAIIAAVAFTPLYDTAFMKIWGLTAGANAQRIIEISRWDWIAAAVRGAALAAVLLTMRTRFRYLWLSAGVLFLCADLGPVMHQLNPRMPRSFFTRPPEVAGSLAPDRRSYRVFHEADWYGSEEAARKYFSTGSHVYWVVRNGLFPMTPAGHGIRTVLERDYDKTALLPTIDLTDSVWDVKRNGRQDWWRPFMAMSNAWYRGVHRDFDAEKGRTGGDFRRSRPIAFVAGPKYPRYYFADRVVPIKDRKDFVAKLTAATGSDTTAYVSGGAFEAARGTVTAVRERSNSAVIDVAAEGRAFLVMSVTPHKYWRVTIDGQAAKAVVTNIGYQGVIVPPGRHRIEMRYRNDMIAIGAPVSAMSAVLLALLAILAGRRRSAPQLSGEEPQLAAA